MGFKKIKGQMFDKDGKLELSVTASLKVTHDSLTKDLAMKYAQELGKATLAAGNAVLITAGNEGYLIRASNLGRH